MAKNRRGRAAGRRKQLQRLNKELHEVGTFDPSILRYSIFERAEAEFKARQPPPPPTPTYRSYNTSSSLPTSKNPFPTQDRKKIKRLLPPPSTLPNSIFERRPTKLLPLDSYTKKNNCIKEKVGPNIRKIESVKFTIRREGSITYIKNIASEA